MNFEVVFYILCGVCGALAGALVYFIRAKNASDMQRDEAEKLCRRYLERIEKLEHTIVADLAKEILLPAMDENSENVK